MLALRRVFGAVLGAWFLANAVGQEALHHCPKHSAAAHAMQHSGHATHAPSQSGGAEHCTCPGDCCPPQAIDAPRPIAWKNEVTIVVTVVRVPTPSEWYPAFAWEGRPFTRGPPASI